MKVLGYKIAGENLVNAVLKLKPNKKAEMSLTKVGEDIWFTDVNVPAHTDNTKKGHDTVLFVIQNDRNASFGINGKEEFLNGGKIIRFNGHLEHYACGYKSGRMSFIIWDVPTSKKDKDCVREIEERIIELNELYKEKN
jgi:hypothetical protein